MSRFGNPIQPIKIEGLRQLQASLKALDGESQKQIRVALNEASEIVVKVARPRIPTVTGAAARSLKLSSSQREARITTGGRGAPYYPWLDYGGRVGRNRSVNRRFEKGGRYLYPAYHSQQANIAKLLKKRLEAIAEGAGLEVTP